MRYRGPLFTLAVAVVWFVALLVANMVVHPVGTPVTHAGAPPTEVATTTPSAAGSATRTRDATAFPDRAVYAGRTEDETVALGVAIADGRAVGYLCDGAGVAAWLSGTATGSTLMLLGRDGYAVAATLAGDRLAGTTSGPGGERLGFELTAVEAPAGLYRAGDTTVTAGWVVAPDGRQVGVVTGDGDPRPAPRLNLRRGVVTAAGRDFPVHAVAGDDPI